MGGAAASVVSQARLRREQPAEGSRHRQREPAMAAAAAEVLTGHGLWVVLRVDAACSTARAASAQEPISIRFKTGSPRVNPAT